MPLFVMMTGPQTPKTIIGFHVSSIGELVHMDRYMSAIRIRKGYQHVYKEYCLLVSLV